MNNTTSTPRSTPRSGLHRHSGAKITPGGGPKSPNEATSPRSKMRYGEPKDKRGYLRKEGRTLRLKTKRYLSLCGKTLSHHRDEQSPPTWSLDVTKMSAICGPRAGELQIVYEGRTVSFFTHDAHDLADWIQVLKRARANIDDWYTTDKEIGRGSYGTVYLGEDKETQEKVAIKIIQKNPSSKRQTKFLEREVRYVEGWCFVLSTPPLWNNQCL